MSGRFEIIVAYVDKGVGKTSSAAALVDQFNSNKDGFSLVNQTAQMVASVVSVASITTVTLGLLPFVSVTAHTLAATMTFLKIVVDFKSEGVVERADVWSLVGNVAGVVAGITLLAGFTAAAPWVAGVAIGTGVMGILSTDVVKNILKVVVQPLWDKNFKGRPDANYENHFISPDLTVLPQHRIETDYEGKIAKIVWDPSNDSISIERTEKEPDDPDTLPSDGVGDSDGGIDAPLGGNPSFIIPESFPAPGPAPGSEPAPAPGPAPGLEPVLAPGPAPSPEPVPAPDPGPVQEPTAPVGGGDTAAFLGEGGGSSPGGGTVGGGISGRRDEIEISIESIGGNPALGHPPLRPDEPQDQYGCCTNRQDSYN